ncbi:DNA polymerase [Pectobacterium phage POP72]|uniref:DNA polymerase n=2 Tax=Axomammavirus PP1 TaxID=2733578 RepID=I7EWA7_9CAUD|nr:DNA polymerase [Pectobacterium phage PP1]AFP33678.1 putative DNA polymerase [Pectobacterium phage PP1]ARB10933.1 DNA polymerase [Pectobacterium phage POP72]
MTTIDWRKEGQGRILVMDAESKGLLPKIRHNKGNHDVHILCVMDLITTEEWLFFNAYDDRDPESRARLEEWEGHQDGTLEDGVKFLYGADAIVSQNFLGYDGMLLEKSFPDIWKGYNYTQKRGKKAFRSDIAPLKVMDTLVMSRLLNPDRRLPPQAYAKGLGNVGPHSIEAHGIRIGRYKPENEDWSKLTDHMVHRVREDVAIGRDMFLWLLNGEWKEHLARGVNNRTALGITTALHMESITALEMCRQAERGFRLDIDAAVALCDELDEQIDATVAGFRPHMPMRIKSKPFKPTEKQEYVDQANAFSLEHKIGVRLADDAFLHAERRSDRKTVWSVTTKSGDWSASVKKDFPHLRGNRNDTPSVKHIGPYTPVTFEDIPLGNRDTVKQVIYPYGWRGVEYNDTEQAHIDEYGVPPKPWSGKINEKSIKLWQERAASMGKSVPDWCLGIASWYILVSRRGQVLNRGDVETFHEKGHWPSQAGTRKCRGLVPVAYNKDLGITAQEFYETYGKWPTSDIDDGEWRVPAIAISIGTSTFRMRHRNVVNIPARGLYPLRHLFIAGKRKMILGCDGAGLELRVLSHFMNDPEYQDIVLNGDIHTYNQLKAGLPKRDMAKTFIYAFLYGSGIANLAAVCGITEDEMREVVARFEIELPALARLRENVIKAGNKYGYLQAPDGHWGRIRMANGELKEHTMLNVLLQMTGSLCMKYALVKAFAVLRREGVALDETGNPAGVANVHDEIQMEVDADEVLYVQYDIKAADWDTEEKRQHVDSEGRMWSAPAIVEGNKKEDEYLKIERRYHRAGQVIAEAMTWAGEYLKMRCKMEGEYKIGKSWAETH